jgi:hypothetical protein
VASNKIMVAYLKSGGLVSTSLHRSGGSSNSLYLVLPSVVFASSLRNEMRCDMAGSKRQPHAAVKYETNYRCTGTIIYACIDLE